MGGGANARLALRPRSRRGHPGTGHPGDPRRPRRPPRRAVVADRALERAALRIAGGTSVAVFPEGTRSADGSVRPFKKGSFVLAIEAGVPVIPVSLAGVKRVAPQGLLRLRPGELAMTLHPPIPTAGRGVEEAGAPAGPGAGDGTRRRPAE